MEALKIILPMLPAEYPLSVMIVQHRSKAKDDFLCRFFNDLCALPVIEAEEKIPIQSGKVYLAPPNYHMHVEMDRTLSLSVDPPVNWSRPSIDVLFETAAEAYQNRLVGIILTGANKDGSQGLSRIKQFGGLAIIQEPKMAIAPQMPLEAMSAVIADHVLTLEAIGRFLAKLGRQ